MRILLVYVLLLAVATMCVADIGEPSDQAWDAINRKVYELAERADRLHGLPRERLPSIMVTTIEDFDAKTTCSSWTIWLDVRLVNEDLAFVLDWLLPHEYAHLVQCWQGGGRIYEELHGYNWTRISLSLGGPGYDHYGRTR